jgi:hypothetical protein
MSIFNIRAKKRSIKNYQKSSHVSKLIRQRMKSTSSEAQKESQGRSAALMSEIIRNPNWQEQTRPELSREVIQKFAGQHGNQATQRLLRRGNDPQQNVIGHDQDRSGDIKPQDETSRIQERLGRGQPLDSGIRLEMEAGLGQPLGEVIVHTDSTAAQLADEQNAKAFTVGKHIAFGNGEYQPGTLIGDALMAHELAHVIQQKGATQKDSSNCSESGLETDANRAVVGLARERFGSIQMALAGFTQLAGARMRSGIRIARCAKAETPEEKYNQVKETLSRAEKGFKAAEKVLPYPELSKKAGEVSELLGKVNGVVDKVEKGAKIYKLVSSFERLSHYDPSTDPQGFAKAAGETLASVGDILASSGIPLVSAYGELLKGAGNFFVDMKTIMDPKFRLRHHEAEERAVMP